MSKSNGQAEIPVKEEQKIEQELPAADPADGFQERTEQPADAPSIAASETEKLRAERDNLLDRLARLQAEFDNYRKRSARENQDYRDYAVSDAARGLLPVIDSFGLALKNAEAKPQDLRKGVELIYKQLVDALQRMNVQRVPAQGEPFDPRVHEAIEMVPSDDVPDNHVLEELQPGYRIKDRLLRPAMVRVAKKVS
ncbi:MAG TPA: nucleotide exchange factor GrpE [Candidatus Angelobacter sp.]|jgi:molecular chaperone GrpE|nr:nucleotide exchange factor GrpE [Candidatus Angelobacter sp.]